MDGITVNFGIEDHLRGIIKAYSFFFVLWSLKCPPSQIFFPKLIVFRQCSAHYVAMS